MPLSVTNRSRRFYIFVVLWLRLVPLVFSFPHDSQKHKRHSSEAFRITNLPRGGGNDETRHQDESDDDEDRTRFWSLSALFRLNANAKDDASTSLATSHLDRGNRRGGALAVRTSKSKTFVDVTPVSTAASRLVSHEEDENMNDYDESIEPLTTDELRESEMIGVEGIEEETESSEESMMDEEEESDDQASAREVFEEDNGPEVDTPAQPIAGEFAEEDIASESEEQVSDADNMTGSDILRKIREDIAVDRDTEELTEILHRDVAVEVDEMAVSESSSYYTPSKAKEMIQDASKYWWNNVWTEQTSEEIPDLDELVSDESDPEVSMPEKNEVDEISSDTRIIDVDIQEIDMEEIEIQEPSEVVEPPPDLWMRQEPEIIPVDVQVIDEASAEGTTLGPDMTDSSLQQVEPPRKKESPFVSSGYWGTIDKVVSLGLSEVSPSWKLSRHLRSVRKATAHATGLHGFLSQKGKKTTRLPENAILPATGSDATLDDDDLGMLQRRIAAIEIAKQNVAKKAAERAEAATRPRRGLFGRRRRARNQQDEIDAAAAAVAADVAELEDSEIYLTIERMSLEEQLEEQRRKERVREIDKLISKGQKALVDLQCEKDDLQRRPNPLYNYTAERDGRTSRKFNFPPPELVDEYIGELLANGRLEKMNHTDLWKNGGELDDDEEESIGDDLFVPSADARKLYERKETKRSSSKGSEPKSSNGNGGGGSWLLRQNLGKGGSLGEKIGETTETAAYKAVCAAVMSSLARSIAAIHGVNIMTHTDIRLYVEQSPDLPPLGKNIIPGSDESHNYAQEAILDAMRKGTSKRKKRGSRSRRSRTEDAFMQRDAVVETLLSHCQISAPLLKLFPLSWQRALLGNIITLIAAVVSDFCDGIQLQILGHQLSFSFKPITESDMIRYIGLTGTGFNHRRARPEQFEAAVRATADDVSENLQFLDRWHHRALGSGMLRAQIANLIARIVLTLADEVLSGARMDLWSAQVGGPRMLAGLEFRVPPEDVNNNAR